MRTLKRSGSLEGKFDIAFTASLAQREKQIQQNYRPIIGIHKWFARRPGTLFRNLLLSEFNGDEPIETGYWRSHDIKGVIGDPFMGGGTPILEANRLGFSVVGTDINPMAFWIVRQSLGSLDLKEFQKSAERIADDLDILIGEFYKTTCMSCGKPATVKYFIWVKTQACPSCGVENDLFPGYLLAKAVRHPKNVVVCQNCGCLNEYDRLPSQQQPEVCNECKEAVYVEGPAQRNKITCRACRNKYSYPPKKPSVPPKHRMLAIEYFCENCKSLHKGRSFKRPDIFDLDKFELAQEKFREVSSNLTIPINKIPHGDETDRLHRWGYTYYAEMFNDRQLLGLGLLLNRILQESIAPVRHAILTVFSDFLRYQNMLAHYDTYALKCQDIFSVHGFPVGLIQCEDNLIGIPGVGSGAFRHYIEKYIKAKEYCLAPFETQVTGEQKKIIPIDGERIEVGFVNHFPDGNARQAWIKAAPATELELLPNSLDGVFTDPPYFDNVQYAELIDFCFVWLRLALMDEFPCFRPDTTRAELELTGNITMGRGLENFTQGLSDVFCNYAIAMKPNAPFVFTYHHNDPLAYIPLIVAILDAGLNCTATLPAPAEMAASLHIARSNSSVLDTVFVCRKFDDDISDPAIGEQLDQDIQSLRSAGLKVTEGDFRCLLAGHIARVAINRLKKIWNPKILLEQKVAIAQQTIHAIREEIKDLIIIFQMLDKRA